jgi:hypothetical protein
MAAFRDRLAAWRELSDCDRVSVQSGAPFACRYVNKRDALALLDLIAGCIENHPREQVDRVTWSHVGDAAHMRERLLEIAIGYALGPDGDERLARCRIEEALCTNDEDVGEALIDAM